MNLLKIHPRPLLMSHQGLVVSWSPKAACSHVVIWFFLKEGLLRAANYYHSWPHNFRGEVYYNTQTYKHLAARLNETNGAGQTLLKVVRNPRKRLVSIFRHVCKYAILRRDIDRKLNIDTDLVGLSLRDFDAYLDNETTVVPSRLDMHVCAQYHPVWMLPFSRVVTINMDEINLDCALNSFEESVGLERTDFRAVRKFTALKEKHYAKAVPYEGSNIEDHRFRSFETDNFPKIALENSPLTHAMAERHYGIDFAATQSGDTKKCPSLAKSL